MLQVQVQGQRDPRLAQRLATAADLARECRADELATLAAQLAADGVQVPLDDEVLLASLLAVAHCNTGNREQARQVLAAAEPLLPAASPLRQARFQSVAASVLHESGDPEQAVDRVLRALALVEEEHESSEDLRVTLGNCGMALAKLHLFPFAVETAARAIKVAADAGQWIGRAEMQAGYSHLTWGLRLEHLGLTADARQQWTAALGYFGGALDQTQLSSLFQAWAAAGRAICTARLGRIEDSRRDLAFARELRIEPTSQERERLVAHATASLLLAEGRLAEARAELLRTWDLTRTDQALWLQDVAWLLGQAATAAGDDREALRWHREMHERYGRSLYDAWLSRATAARLQIEQEALVRRTQELESDVLSDPLTGVPNRRAFDANLPRLVAAAQAAGTPLALAIIDIDRFKRVNDSYGHSIGDEVLRRVARILHEESRGADRCARYGGDELVLCLPAELAEATAALTRIAGTIADHPWSTVAPGLTVTVSTGLAELAAGDTATTLFWAADQSLLTARRARRSAPDALPSSPSAIPPARAPSPSS
jgi:diguanylate cyclase (GGDEF)-like protein